MYWFWKVLILPGVLFVWMTSEWLTLAIKLIYRCVVVRKQGVLRIGKELVYVAGGEGGDGNYSLVISPTNHTHVLHGFRINRENLKKYKALCGYDPEDNSVPVCYGETLFFKLLLTAVTSGKFCLSPLGLIHIRQTVMQHEALSKYVDSDLTLSLTVKQYREAERGVEVDIQLRILVNQNRCVWEGTVTLLSRSKPVDRDTSRPREREDSEERFPLSSSVSVRGNCGVKYAMLTGDFNPHHLYTWTAKLLGFKRPIAHGMWTLARTIAVIQEYDGELAYGRVRVTCSFKRPL